MLEAVSNIAQHQEAAAAGQRQAGHLRQLADVRVHERERHQVHFPLACKQTKVSIEEMVVNTEHELQNGDDIKDAFGLC